MNNLGKYLTSKYTRNQFIGMIKDLDNGFVFFNSLDSKINLFGCPSSFGFKDCETCHDNSITCRECIMQSIKDVKFKGED